MSEWRETTLGQFVSLQRGHDLPTPDRQPGSIPVVGSGGVTGWHNVARAKGPGITIGRAANLGVPTLVKDDFWPLNTTLYVTDFCGNDVRFTFHLFQVLDLAGFNSGSVQPMLNRNYIQQVPIRVPGANGQRAIAAVLGALDDKIAVNERIAATAINLAEAIYQDASTDPRWRDMPLGKTARWMSGGTPTTSEPEFWNGDIPWISALSLKSPWITDSDRKVTDLGSRSGTRVVPRDVVLFVVRGSSLKTEFRIGITQRDVAFGQDCKALIADPTIDPHMLFHAIRSKTPAILEMVDETSIGAGRLSTDLLTALPVRLPVDRSDKTNGVLRNFDSIASNAEEESRTLAALRDTLLPKLMSGQLTVRQAETIVEDAV